MAEAYGKLTGQPGVCMVTRGPGATHAACGVHTAFQDSTPMVMFVGQVGNNFVEREAFQEIDYRRMFGQMAKWVAQIDRADRVPEYVAHAFQVATSGRPGPVVLALPEDLLDETADVADAACHQPVQAAPTDTQIAAVRRLLGQARSPLLLLGGTGWTEPACENMRRFVEANQLPVVSGEVTRSPIPTPTQELTAHVGPSVDYGVYQEFGTRFMTGQPYLIPALRQVEGVVPDEFRRMGEW